MTDKDRDFRNCGFSGKSKKLSEAYFCNRKKLQLNDADLGIGICPCRDWIHMTLRQKDPKNGSGKPENSLF